MVLRKTNIIKNEKRLAFSFLVAVAGRLNTRLAQ